MRTVVVGVISLWSFFTTTAALATSSVTYPARSLSAIDQPLQGRLSLGKAVITADSVSLTATKGSDFYVPQDANAANVSAPLVLFPVSGDFIFSAHVTVSFQNTFDGAALMLYADDKHWAKLLLERAQPDMEGVTSSVMDGKGDDAYHVFLKPNETGVWLKITRQGSLSVFYTSLDGHKWTIARDFILSFNTPILAGFEAQSPLGEQVEAHFDHIRFQAKTPTDFWQGE